jgi:hypothetical protein
MHSSALIYTCVTDPALTSLACGAIAAVEHSATQTKPLVHAM